MSPWRRLRQSLALPPELLVLGHITRDLIGDQARLGGAAAFAARTAACLGVRTALVTAAPDACTLLAPLQEDRHIALRHLRCAGETIFAVDYSGGERRIHLLQRAPSLQPADIPGRFLQAPLAYVAPVIGECDGRVVEALGPQQVVLGAQGWLRAVRDDGLVVPAIAPELEAPPANVEVVVFSELDHPEAERLARSLALRRITVALTRGRGGATLFTAGHSEHVAAAPAQQTDPTGAGDVFGVVLALALRRGVRLPAAAAQAAFAAARVVEGPGLGNLPAHSHSPTLGPLARRAPAPWPPRRAFWPDPIRRLAGLR